MGAKGGVIGRMQTSCLPHVCSTATLFFLQEKVIPSVVIEPASNNEGEEEHETAVGAESKEATKDASLPGPTGETAEPAPERKTTEPTAEDPQPAPSAPSTSEASLEVPPGFLYKVLTFLIFKIWWPFVLPLLGGRFV